MVTYCVTGIIINNLRFAGGKKKLDARYHNTCNCVQLDMFMIAPTDKYIIKKTCTLPNTYL